MVHPTTNTSVKPVTVLTVYSVYLHLVAAILFLSLFLSSLYLSISEYAPAIYINRNIKLVMVEIFGTH